jgi:hypothetical protein
MANFGEYAVMDTFYLNQPSLQTLEYVGNHVHLVSTSTARYSLLARFDNE